MPHRIIIELDEQEVRVAQASWDARRSHLTKVFSIPLSSDSDVKSTGAAIKAAIQRNGLHRADVDVILNRRAIEMREIMLPPAPDNELPDMLRFSARNEFASVNDNWRIDFVHLTNDPTAKRAVLASALSPQLLSELTAIVEGCGLRLGRILLRPFCVAMALRSVDPVKPVLVVHDLGHSLDLTIIQNHNVQLTRTVLKSTLAAAVSTDEPNEASTVPAHSADASAAIQQIIQETQRVLMMSSRLPMGRAVVEILIAADSKAGQELCKALQGAVGVPVSIVDSQQLLAGRGSVGGEHPERFLAHQGAAQSITATTVPQIDFSNPRRREVRKTNYRRLAFWGGAAALLAIGCGISGWVLLASQTRTIASLTVQRDELKKANESLGNRPGVDQVVGEVQLIDKWELENVNWIEELSEISQRMLTADDAIVGSFNGALGQKGPEIKIRGRTTQSERNSDLMTNLAQRPYDVKPGKFGESGESGDYPYEFDCTLYLVRSNLDIHKLIGDRIRAEKNKTSDSTTKTDEPTEPASQEE